jgi:hypothetical protein
LNRKIEWMAGIGMARKPKPFGSKKLFYVVQVVPFLN